MGIKRPKTTQEATSPEASAPLPAEQKIAAGETTPARSPDKASTSAAEQNMAGLGTQLVVWSAASHGELGKRMRRKGSLMSRADSSGKLPGLAGSPMRGSPEPSAVQGVGSPATTSFPARRRSIASPARRRSFTEGQPAAPAPEGRMRVPKAAGSSSSGSSSSSASSCSSSSSSSSSGEPDGEIAASTIGISKWGGPLKEGQRFPTPAISDTARDFFMTLLEENPNSYIATEWLVEHGVFPVAKHNKMLEKYEVQKELRRKARAEALAAGTVLEGPRKGFRRRGSKLIVQLHKRPRTLRKG